VSRKKKSVPVIFQGLEAGLKMFRLVVLALLVWFLFSGIEWVAPDSVGLLLRFGKLQGVSSGDQIRKPGLVPKLPYPIDELIQVPVQKEGEVTSTEVWKEITDVAALDQIDPLVEGYCLTGDNNIVQSKMVVKFRIQDTVRYRLWMRNAEGILHDVALAALVQTVAGWSVDDVLRLQRPVPDDPKQTESLAKTVKERAQQRLNLLDTGLVISALELKEMHPPRHVVSDFRDVQNARIDVDTAKREAERIVNEKIPAAEAEANRLVQSARAELSSLVSRAKAEYSVFEQVYNQYRTNPEVVRGRLFEETWEEIGQKVGKLRLVDAGTRVVLPDQDVKPSKETRP
jgi:membrane protease subunit HflK